MKNKKKMNNKGFSLVELIIVIAIMAVLIGVLAPQYIRYVERGRRSADGATMDSYVNAMQVLATDPDITLNASSTSYTVTSGPNSGTITVGTDLTALLANFEIDTAAELTSTDFRAADIAIKLEYDTTNKQWKVSGTDSIPDV